jgi:hypothetical protein
MEFQMGCGCAKKISNSRRKKREIIAKKSGSVIRKRRVSRLIAIPGKTAPRRKVTATETAKAASATEET